MQPEYTVANKRVDYALRVDNHNKAFIELKKIGTDLEQHQEQLLNYSFQEGLRLAILTNGIGGGFICLCLRAVGNSASFTRLTFMIKTPMRSLRSSKIFFSKKTLFPGKRSKMPKTFRKQAKEGDNKEHDSESVEQARN